jgi:DNA-binding IclR family transcriptional regulator
MNLGSTAILAHMRQGREYSVTYLARLLGQPASMTRRLLAELVKEGLVQTTTQTSWSTVYILTPTDAETGSRASAESAAPPVTIATSPMKQRLGGAVLQGYEASLSRHRLLAMLGRGGR